MVACRPPPFWLATAIRISTLSFILGGPACGARPRPDDLRLGIVTLARAGLTLHEGRALPVPRAFLPLGRSRRCLLWKRLCPSRAHCPRRKSAGRITRTDAPEPFGPHLEIRLARRVSRRRGEGSRRAGGAPDQRHGLCGARRRSDREAGTVPISTRRRRQVRIKQLRRIGDMAIQRAGRGSPARPVGLFVLAPQQRREGVQPLHCFTWNLAPARPRRARPLVHQAALRARWTRIAASAAGVARNTAAAPSVAGRARDTARSLVGEPRDRAIVQIARGRTASSERSRRSRFAARHIGA